MNYNELYKEFDNKWHFTLGREIGTYNLVLSNGVYKLYTRIQDKRCYYGYKHRDIFKTTDANEMRDYLTNNEPQKGYIIRTKDGHYVGLFNYGRSYQVAFTKRVLKCTRDEAERVAQAFDGVITEVSI